MSDMEALITTLTDQQRVEALNNIYQKGISTPKEKLAFSADKLVYLKPFISKLQSDNSVTDLNSKTMARKVIDELLQDILDEVRATSVNSTRSEKIAMEYGLQMLTAGYQDDFYLTNKVA